MEIRRIEASEKDGVYYQKFEISKYNQDGKLLSDYLIKKAILDHLYPVPAKIKKNKGTGYFEARINGSYLSIFSPVLR